MHSTIYGCGQLYNAVVEITREAQISFYNETDSNNIVIQGIETQLWKQIDFDKFCKTIERGTSEG